MMIKLPIHQAADKTECDSDKNFDPAFNWEEDKMKTFVKLVGSSVLITLMTATMMLGGCGGGGGGDSAFSGAADTGTVGVFLTDGPADDYDHFWLWLKTIKIYPANKKEPIIIFKSEDPNGQRIDLLDLRDRELLLGIKKRVRTGRYSRIGMEFGGIKPEGPGICAARSIIANNKIDYSQDFEVLEDVTTALHIDVDVDKSLNSPDDGKSEDCEFWPVLFVKVDNLRKEQDCPQVVSGVVQTILFEADGTTVMGFKLAVKEPWFHKYGEYNDQKEWHHCLNGFIDVIVSDSETTIYDDDGSIIKTEDLIGTEGRKVVVRGLLQENGDLDASLVVFGGISVFKGTVTASSTENYELDLANGSGSFVVSLGDESVILTDCDEAWDKDQPIPLYYAARVYGQFVDENNTFLGIVTLMRPQKLAGALVGIVAELDTSGNVMGYILSVVTKNGPLDVFLPEDDSDNVFLQRDGAIDIRKLEEYVECQPRNVEIVTNPVETDRLTAASVTVLAEVIIGTVAKIDDIKRLITTEEGDTIYFLEDARIIKLTFCRNADKEDDNDHQDEIDFSDIKMGDKIKAYGLQECPVDDPDSIFDAYIGILRPAPEPPQPNTIIIKRNKISFFLPAGKYKKNIDVAGNKVRFLGQAGEKCDDDDGWTILKGQVRINGNKAKFANIKFKDSVIINGNKAKFYNVVFEDIVIDDGNNTKFRSTCIDYISDNDDDDGADDD